MKQIFLTSIGKDELVQIFTVVIEDAIKRHNKTEQEKVVIKEELGDNLTRKEVLALCKIKSLATLWNWKQKGKLVPKKKAGKKPLYLRQDVEDFLKGINKESNSKAA